MAEKNNQSEKKPEAKIKTVSSEGNLSKEEKNVAALSYLFILFLVPLLTKKKSKFAQFHAKQGLILTICWFIASFTFILAPIAYLFCLILMIIGFMNVMSGKMEPLPVVGKLAEKFDF